MEKCFNKVLLFDGSYVLHRALHTPSLQELETIKNDEENKFKTGGVFGALRIFQSEMNLFPGYYPIWCFDHGLSSRRLTLYPDYKANRNRQTADGLVAVGAEGEEDEYLKEYHRQRSDLIEILKTLGVPTLIVSGWEGDDLLYLISEMTEDCILESDDKDLSQLVSPNVTIRRALRDEVIHYGDDDYYTYPRFVIRKAIVGDPSDNLPKPVKGLGEKGADQIAQIIQDVPMVEWKDYLTKYVQDNPKEKIDKKIIPLLEDDSWDKFIINYKMTDLRLNTYPVGFEDMMKDMIKTDYENGIKIFETYNWLGKYEIESIYPDQIATQLNQAKENLYK